MFVLWLQISEFSTPHFPALTILFGWIPRLNALDWTQAITAVICSLCQKKLSVCAWVWTLIRTEFDETLDIIWS